MDLPYKDCSLRFPADFRADLNAEYLSELHHLTEKVRATRGKLLAAAYEAEYTVDEIIRLFFFRGEDKQTGELGNTFEALFLKSRPVSLDRKIEILKTLSRQLPLASIFPSDLLNRLKRVKTLRNQFAHYAVAFDIPENRNGKLIAKLVCSDREITLDDDFLKSTDELLMQVNSDLREVMMGFIVEIRDLPRWQPPKRP